MLISYKQGRLTAPKFLGFKVFKGLTIKKQLKTVIAVHFHLEHYCSDPRCSMLVSSRMGSNPAPTPTPTVTLGARPRLSCLTSQISTTPDLGLPRAAHLERLVSPKRDKENSPWRHGMSQGVRDTRAPRAPRAQHLSA